MSLDDVSWSSVGFAGDKRPSESESENFVGRYKRAVNVVKLRGEGKVPMW